MAKLVDKVSSVLYKPSTDVVALPATIAENDFGDVLRSVPLDEAKSRTTVENEVLEATVEVDIVPTTNVVGDVEDVWGEEFHDATSGPLQRKDDDEALHLWPLLFAQPL